jgi:hypothetical protein
LESYKPVAAYRRWEAYFFKSDAMCALYQVISYRDCLQKRNQLASKRQKATLKIPGTLCKHAHKLKEEGREKNWQEIPSDNKLSNPFLEHFQSRKPTPCLGPDLWISETLILMSYAFHRTGRISTEGLPPGERPFLFLAVRTYSNYPLALFLVQSVRGRFGYPAGQVPGDFPS